MTCPKQQRYTARICWNTNGWAFPSGSARTLEEGSYVARTGFGHEEWLLNLSWLIDGFHYAFLQPVNRSLDNLRGQRIDILLYTVDPQKRRLYVGEIANCEVLTHDQAADALKVYQKRGWLKAMIEHVASVGGDTSQINSDPELFNIRFRREDADVYHELRLADRADAVWNLNRYTLAAAGERIEKQWRARKGSVAAPSTAPITRAGAPPVTFDPIHKRLQADLLAKLQIRYGKENVLLEEAGVDVTIKGKKTVLVELKTTANARLAIREALGQLLEYAYFRTPARPGPLELIIMAPGRFDDEAKNYMQQLRGKFNFPVQYCCYSEGDPLPGVFGDSKSQPA